ncbi:Mechanosensitive ion channel [Reichenbachiella faecimaris]|uniref:Mechanosensitive ion channel n=1 Tax=Reichenbachiella faecimaris TaxID=692418 RepID=A0A1W2GNH6_REIFA|nr:mechanosensitive ion channel family protein [Reichenbachiella faecimaris]SMD38197.1 Mechanosensitive ion channel [Reichenbachiella faecimaris]
MNKLVFISLWLITSFSSYGQASDSLSLAKIDSIVVAKVDSVHTLDSAQYAQQAVEKKKVDLKTPPQVTELISLPNLFWSLIFIIVGYFVIKFTSRILEIFAERSTKYRITIKSVIPVIKILGWVVVIFLIVVGIYQPPASTVLAFSASIGVAVGFASQDILKNIFGGIVILFDRPFNSGDKIQVGDTYGEVVEIGLRSTRIVTPDDNLVTIPNGEIMNSSVSNANAGEANCQVVAEIYLPINADTVHVRALAIQAAQVSKYVFLNKPIVVVFSNEHKERQSIIKMKIKAYVLDIRDEFKFKSEMTEIVIKKLLEEGILTKD